MNIGKVLNYFAEPGLSYIRYIYGSKFPTENDMVHLIHTW